MTLSLFQSPETHQSYTPPNTPKKVAREAKSPEKDKKDQPCTPPRNITSEAIHEWRTRILDARERRLRHRQTQLQVAQALITEALAATTKASQILEHTNLDPVQFEE